MSLEGRGGLQLALRAAASSPLGRVAAAGAALLLVIVAMATMGAAGFNTSAPSCAPAAGDVVVGDVGGLPAQARRFAPLYVAAAQRHQLGERGPAILASIHQTESAFGANMGPSSAGALGHMQFMPKTWSDYGVDANGDGEKDPYDPADAIHGAARYLRASGAPGDWYAAIFAYNHADWYVQEILAGAEAFGDVGELADATTVACEGAVAGASAELEKAIRVYEPARDQRVPERYIAPGFGPIVIDARIWPNVRWVLESYELVLTAGKETGHASHGDGSAIDAVPAENIGSVAHWRRTAVRVARDFGWTPMCASSGVRPACELIPAIEFIGYNGYDASHGDPAHSAIAHIHISWVSETHGTPYLTTPEWMLVFPSPTAAGESPTGSPVAAPADEPEALVVGDSVTVGSAPHLRRRLSDQVEIDARVGRASSEGLEVLKARLDGGHSIVAFALGANDDPARPGALAANLRRARELAGERCLVVSTVHVPNGGALNGAIRDFAASAADVELVDWHRLADGSGLLAPDGLHATQQGYRRLANAVIAAMLEC